MSARIAFDRGKIADFCRRWDITELALFGSVLRDDFGPESDVDVLVTFAPEAHIGFLALGAIAEELSALLGRKADVVPKGGLKTLILDEVLSEAEVLYAA